MSHLCEMETAYRAWVQRALDEDGANVDGIAATARPSRWRRRTSTGLKTTSRSCAASESRRWN